MTVTKFRNTSSISHYYRERLTMAGCRRTAAILAFLLSSLTSPTVSLNLNTAAPSIKINIRFVPSTVPRNLGATPLFFRSRERVCAPQSQLDTEVRAYPTNGSLLERQVGSHEDYQWRRNASTRFRSHSMSVECT
jgi:hypothetical protein